MKLSTAQIQSFQKEILNWYKKNKRDLPWRHPSLKLRNGLRDPYKILVSEVMSQQTQISRVVPKYEEWMEVFPDIQSLAKASTRDVLLHWSGLGYNRRALYVKKCAEILVYYSSSESAWADESRSRSESSSQLRSNSKILRSAQNDMVMWPRTEKELMKLPGIGEYTARAILCFAFNEQVAVVDTNVRKVILVQFKNAIPGLTTFISAERSLPRNLDSRSCGNDKEDVVVQQIADKLLPKGKAYEWNQALMDYAAAVLRPVKVDYGRAKQKAFKDSDRYFRGLTIRLLLQEKYLSFEDLMGKVLEVSTIDRERYRKIIGQLEREELIKKKDDELFLS